MSKFKKALKSKIILVLISAVFFVTNTAYGIDLPDSTHLRKQLDFNTREISPKYLCTMIAAAIHRGILDGNSNASPRNILEGVIEKNNMPDLFQKIEQFGIKIEKDKKGTIWVYYEPESIYIAIQKDGQFAPPEDIKAFRKAKIKSVDKKLALEGKFYKSSPRKKGRLKKLFLTTMLAGTIGFTLLTTTSILLYRHITYDPFNGATYRQIEIFEEDRKVTSSWEVSVENFLNKLDYLQNQELTYNEILDCTNWLNHNIWYIEREGGKLGRKDLERLLDFLENPRPIKSNSVSARWLVTITKCTIMDLWLPTIARKQGHYDAIIKAAIQRLTNYKEYLPVTDQLFLKYFPSISAQEILSEKIQEKAKRWLDEEYNYQYSRSYKVVDRLFRIFGTVEDIDAKLNEIHQIETADTIKIPIWQLDDVEYNRKLDPKIKTYIEESAKAHNIPPRVILTHLLNVWKRSYVIGSGIDIVKSRGRISEEQAEWLKETISKIDDDLLTYTFPPDVVAFIGGVVLDAQSTTGIGRLRPVWVQRNQGFDRLGETSENMSTREIAWKLWSPEYNIEAIARLWEVLAQEGEKAISDAKENRIFDTRRFDRETGARLFTADDTARVAFYQLCPSPDIFRSKGEGWMNSVWHPVEIELQLQRMGSNPWSYNPGVFLPQQIEIARSAIFGPQRQKAIITGIETVEDVTTIGEFLKSEDSFIRNAAIETLRQLTDSNDIEIKRKASELLIPHTLKAASIPIDLVRELFEEGANVLIVGEVHYDNPHRTIMNDIIVGLEKGEMDYLAIEHSKTDQDMLNSILEKLDSQGDKIEEIVREELYELVQPPPEFFPPDLAVGAVKAYVDILVSAHKKGIKIVCIDPRVIRVDYTQDGGARLINTGRDGYITIDGKRRPVDEVMAENILHLKGKILAFVGLEHATNNWSIRYLDYEKGLEGNTLPSLGSIIKKKMPQAKIVLQHTVPMLQENRTELDNLISSLNLKGSIGIILNDSELSSVNVPFYDYKSDNQTFGKSADAIILHPTSSDSLQDNGRKIKQPGRSLQKSIREERQNRDLLDKSI